MLLLLTCFVVNGKKEKTNENRQHFFQILHNITLHNITLHNITLHNITLHNITLHNITLHNITLHNITLHQNISIYELVEFFFSVFNLYKKIF